MAYDPYIHFQGNCAEAMQFYQGLFGGDLALMTYGEMPGAPSEMQGSARVMHACLTTGGRELMASDFPPGMQGDAQAAVSVSHPVADLAEGQRIFTALSDGGAVLMDFAPTFWSDGFGMVKDRFGTHWMVSGPARQG